MNAAARATIRVPAGDVFTHVHILTFADAGVLTRVLAARQAGNPWAGIARCQTLRPQGQCGCGYYALDWTPAP